MKTTKPTVGDWGWFAGLIDGDGCISIQKQNGRYRASVIVVNRKPENILKLLTRFGGSVGGVSRTTATSYVNGRYYRWTISSTDAVLESLKNALPHLAEKREKARIVIQLCEIQKQKRALHTYKGLGAIKEQLELLYQSALVETGRIDESVATEIRNARPALDSAGQAIGKE